MSLFKLREWWSINAGESESYDMRSFYVGPLCSSVVDQSQEQVDGNGKEEGGFALLSFLFFSK